MEETWGGEGGKSKRKRVKQGSFIPEDSCQDIRVCMFVFKKNRFILSVKTVHAPHEQFKQKSTKRN